jgi:hypothetical protein
MFSADFGKILIIIGVFIILVGIILMSIDKIPFLAKLGKFPGDIRIQRENFSFYFPITTSILLSIILSLLFWLFSKR